MTSAICVLDVDTCEWTVDCGLVNRDNYGIMMRINQGCDNVTFVHYLFTIFLSVCYAVITEVITKPYCIIECRLLHEGHDNR